MLSTYERTLSQKPLFQSHHTKKYHLTLLILILVTIILTIARLPLNTRPTTRADTIAIVMVRPLPTTPFYISSPPLRLPPYLPLISSPIPIQVKTQTHNLTLFPSNQGIKSLLFLLYQHLTSPPHRLARFHSLKTNTVLAGLEIVFWAVVFGLSCSGVAQGGVCEGAHCGLGAVVIVLALGIV